MKLLLIVENGSLAGQQFELEKGSLTLGRGADSNIRFDHKLDPGVSTRHAVIRSEDQGYRLTDERSTNGTTLNDQKVLDTLLRDGDRIRLGPQGPILRVVLEMPGSEITKDYKLSEEEPPKTQFFSAPPDLQPQPAPAPPAANATRNPLSGASVQNFSKTEEGRKTLIGCVIAGLVGGFLMMIVMGIMIWQLGFTAALVGAIMAFLPAPLYLFVMIWIDRFDPEPGWAIALAFGWGGLVAILVSLVMNTMFGSAMGGIAGPQQGDTLSAIISAPIFEEGTKGIGVVLLLLLLRKEFDGIVDGIFYAGVIALGFSTFENILYYGGQFLDGGIGAMLSNVFVRGILAPFSHALFTSMTGIGCGIARETHNKMVRLIAPAAGYVLAMILHGFWNAIASAIGGVGYFITYVIVWIPLFLIFVAGVVAAIRREQKMIRRMLSLEIAQSIITREQYDIATSWTRRISWLLSTVGEIPRFNARRKFLRAVTKLAFTLWHAERAATENGRTDSVNLGGRYQAEIQQLQTKI